MSKKKDPDKIMRRRFNSYNSVKCYMADVIHRCEAGLIAQEKATRLVNMAANMLKAMGMQDMVALKGLLKDIKDRKYGIKDDSWYEDTE